MPSPNYTSPVNQILQLAPPSKIVDWSIYANLGITVEHLPELARMAIDEDLLYGEAEAEFLAPPHAWRMLGILGTPAAIAPLITALQDWSEENWDWLGEEIKEVFGHIGVAALPALAETLSNTKHNHYTRENAVMAIAEIGKQHPDSRTECITLLTTQLAQFRKNNPELNAYLITELATRFKAVESVATIEQAYQSGRVNEDFIGDWDDAQVHLGLKDASAVPHRSRNIITHPWEFVPPEPSGFAIGHNAVPKTKATAKRKAQKQSRRQNRKKK
jgi:HEAT repeat protein